MVQIRLYINAVDLTGYLLSPPDGEWEIERQAGGEIDSATFVLDDPTNALTLNGGKEVIIEDFSDSSNRFFGGTLTEATSYSYGIGQRIQCRALGWLFDLSRSVVNYIYRGKSDQYIITDGTEGIFVGGGGKPTDKDMSAYTVNTTNVLEGNDNTQIMVFKGETHRDIMDTLAGWAGFIWGVEPDQTVYYRPYSAGLNSQSFSDAPDESASFPYYSMRHFKNFSEIVNSVYVYGGWQTLEDETRTYGGNGSQTTFTVGHQWRAPDDDDRVAVEVYNGSSWDVKTVGFPQEEGTFDVRWQELTRSFEFAAAPGNYAASWRVTGNIYDQIVKWRKNQPSIDANGEYAITIKDSSLRDEEAAERRAEIELIKRASEGERITLLTTQDGFEVGKLVDVVNTIHGINDSYLVDKMVMHGLGGTLAEYELTLKSVPG